MLVSQSESDLDDFTVVHILLYYVVFVLLSKVGVTASSEVIHLTWSFMMLIPGNSVSFVIPYSYHGDAAVCLNQLHEVLDLQLKVIPIYIADGGVPESKEGLGVVFDTLFVVFAV